MTKRAIYLFILLGLLLFYVPLSNRADNVYVKEGNIWKEAFTEPFEILYVLCEDGDLYGFTTHDEKRVRITPLWLRDFLVSKGHEVSDIILIMHNHFGRPFMSSENMGFMKTMRRLGFTGVFSMIDTASGKIVCIRNDNG